MNTRELVYSLPLADAQLIAEFAYCGDYLGKYQNDAKNLPGFGTVAHLFTEPGGGPRELPTHWQDKPLGAMGQAVQRQNKIINSRLGSLLKVRPNQRMNKENRQAFGKFVTERVIKETQ